MYKVDESNRNGTLSGLISSRVASVLQPGDDKFTAIKSMQSTIRQLSRNPETLRVMTQLEFNYQGVVDASAGEFTVDPLSVDWWDSTFAIADFTHPEDWCKKAVEEASKGRVVVMLIPARTNTAWFHSLVLGRATEVRFIKGMVYLTKNDKPNTLADCIAIYRFSGNTPVNKGGSVAILNFSTSFTSTENELEVLNP